MQDKGKSKWKNDDKEKIEWKVVVHTEEILDLIEEDVILIIEVVFMVIILYVVKET